MSPASVVCGGGLASVVWEGDPQNELLGLLSARPLLQVDRPQEVERTRKERVKEVGESVREWMTTSWPGLRSRGTSGESWLGSGRSGDGARANERGRKKAKGRKGRETQRSNSGKRSSGTLVEERRSASSTPGSCRGVQVVWNESLARKRLRCPAGLKTRLLLPLAPLSYGGTRARALSGTVRARAPSPLALRCPSPPPRYPPRIVSTAANRSKEGRSGLSSPLNAPGRPCCPLNIFSSSGSTVPPSRDLSTATPLVAHQL